MADGWRPSRDRSIVDAAATALGGISHSTTSRFYDLLMAPSRSRRARASRKRKRRMDAADNDLTAEQWLALQESWGGCAYCGTVDASLQKDCVLPLSRGGRYTITNVVPACRSCNASKCNDEVTGWMRRKKLDERSFLLRHRDISVEHAARFAPDDAESDDLTTSPG